VLRCVLHSSQWQKRSIVPFAAGSGQRLYQYVIQAEVDAGRPSRGDSLDNRTRYFESILWPHLRAAYNFARWLVRNDHDAEDIVQESFAKAFQGMDTFRGGDARVWLLAIVRNTAMNFLRRLQPGREVGWSDRVPEPVDLTPDPEHGLIQRSRRDQVRSAIDRLAPEFRETLILREIEELSYKEIASVLKVPVGTVMSRLCRARNLLVHELVGEKGVGL